MSTVSSSAAAVSTGTVTLQDVSRWYGHVIALNNVSLEIKPGLIGLLGPNGAGKTTLLRLITGQLRPTTGQVTVLGESAYDGIAYRRQVGYCPEHDYFYDEMTGFDFVTTMTALHGFSKSEARERAQAALEEVRFPLAEGSGTKPISTYSKGMRQKVKVAQALAHDPKLIVLDEPLNGADPLSRHHIMELCKRLGQRGYTVVISSHVLHEVEAVTREFILIDKGRLVAEGTVSAIRDLIDRHPHRIDVVASDARALGSVLVRQAFTASLHVTSERQLTVETPRPDQCYQGLPKLAAEAGVRLLGVSSADNSLEAVFRYLTGSR